MALHLTEPEEQDLRARITVFGVGGAGGNAVNNMIEKQLAGVEFIAANTDAQALKQSKASRKLQLGVTVTQGLGAGSKPEVGYSAAEETIDEVVEALQGAHMCFITAGMGGGTGTGAAPVVARAAREMGILTVGVVTKPFQFEGSRRMQIAEDGVAAMQEVVDTLIVIPNQNLFQIASERTTFVEAFQMADDVLYQGVQGVTDLMVRPGMINLDFADVRSVMEEMGKAMMGTGEADGDNRAQDAAEKAIANPLLDEVSLKGAKGVLINITGGYDLTLFEMDEAANRIKSEVDPNALIKFGSAIDPDMEGKMRVSVVATGIDAETMHRYDENGRPQRRIATTDPDMVAAARTASRKAAMAARSAPEAPRPVEAIEEPEQEIPADTAEEAVEAAPVAEEAPAEETAPARPAPVFGAAGRSTLSPKPEEIRARAEEVRQRAIEARERRRVADRALGKPEQPAESMLDDAQFELDEGSIDAPREPEPTPAPRQSFIDRQRNPRPAEPRPVLAQEQRAPAREPSRAEREPEHEEEHRSGGLFAINRLIGRVSGNGHAAGHGAPAARTPRSEPRFDETTNGGDDDPEGDIPAFLRRQAN